MRVSSLFAMSLLVLLVSSMAMGQICQKAAPSTPAARAMSQLAAGELELDGVPNLKDGFSITPGQAYVLRVNGPLTPQLKREIYATGAALVESYPGNAFLAYLDRADAQALAQLDFVTWIGEYSNEWKISPGLTGAEGQLPVTIAVFGWRPSDEAVQLVLGAGGTILENRRVLTNHVISATMPGSAIEALAELASVYYVSEGVQVANPGVPIATLEAAAAGPATAQPVTLGETPRVQSVDDLPSQAVRRSARSRNSN